MYYIQYERSGHFLVTLIATEKMGELAREERFYAKSHPVKGGSCLLNLE